MATTPCFDKNCTKSSISRSILNGFAWNLYNRGLIFRDDQNEWQQPHVSTKTAQNHQYLSQFLTDLLETFTIGVNFSRRSKWMATTPCFDKNCTISSISRSILGRGRGQYASWGHAGGLSCFKLKVKVLHLGQERGTQYLLLCHNNFLAWLCLA